MSENVATRVVMAGLAVAATSVNHLFHTPENPTVALQNLLSQMPEQYHATITRNWLEGQNAVLDGYGSHMHTLALTAGMDPVLLSDPAACVQAMLQLQDLVAKQMAAQDAQEAEQPAVE